MNDAASLARKTTAPEISAGLPQGPSAVRQRGQAVQSGSALHLRPGDTVVLAPDTERQITALDDADMIVCARSDAIASVPGETESRGTPPWIS